MIPVGKEQDPSTVVGTREHADAVTRLWSGEVSDALQWLTFAHLPEALQRFSRPFYVAAVQLIGEVAYSPELVDSLKALVTAKDHAVRAGIRSDTGRAGSVPRPRNIASPPLFGQAD